MLKCEIIKLFASAFKRSNISKIEEKTNIKISINHNKADDDNDENFNRELTAIWIIRIRSKQQ